MQRYSKKRQSILDCLRATKSHPGAEWIYSEMKKIYPDISLATVYRNLIILKDAGEIRSVGKVHGQERFDGNAMPHTHAVCQICGKIMDIPDFELPDYLMDEASAKCGFMMLSSDIHFSGICENCRKTEKTK